MKLDFRATARFLARQAVKRAWTTSQQRWTTSFVGVGFLLAAIFVPPFGIAALGTAIAGWWIAVIVVTIVFGLVGNRFGIGREKAALLRDPDRSTRPKPAVSS